jgi:hypothetical protein
MSGQPKKKPSQQVPRTSRQEVVRKPSPKGRPVARQAKIGRVRGLLKKKN